VGLMIYMNTHKHTFRGYRPTFWQQRRSRQPPAATTQLLRDLLSLPMDSAQRSFWPLARCNKLHHTAIHCTTLQHAAKYCNALPSAMAERTPFLIHTAKYFNALQRTATHSHCNTLQHTAIYCNIRQHTATHDNTLCLFVLLSDAFASIG